MVIKVHFKISEVFFILPLLFLWCMAHILVWYWMVWPKVSHYFVHNCSSCL